MMAFAAFLARVVDEGIEAARRDYGDAPDTDEIVLGSRKQYAPRDNDKLAGSIAGFEACRSKTPPQLAALLEEARSDTRSAHRAQAADYWYWRSRELEVEWVCNVISAAFVNEGLPPIIPPTARGMTKAADILGVGPRR